MGRRRAPFVAAVVAVLAVVALAVLLLAGGDEEPRPRGSEPSPAGASADALARSLTVPALVEHMRELERIADRNDGNRAAGGPGDRASARYVAGRLRAAGWRVRLQPVSFPFSAQRSPPRLEAGAREIETTAMRFSGSGETSAPSALAGSGCRSADYAGFPEGSVALVQRGSCLLRDIVLGAQRAGAAGVIVYDTDRLGPPLPGTLIRPGARIPAVTVRGEDASALEAELPRVRLEVDAVSENRTTSNVMAELGSGSRVVMAGAHIDSVPEGPGVNDNGSGIATLVELAEQLGASRTRLRRRIRFGFWGAEELGLYGSRRYVRSLSRDERRRIDGYLNLDMVGSSNGGRLLYGGKRGAAAHAARRVRAWFRSHDIRYGPTNAGQGSDHAPFEAAGIPTIGLFSGASEVKRPIQAQAWGGRAGRPMDPCYHLACDRLARVDRRTLSELSDAAAVVLHAMAQRR